MFIANKALSFALAVLLLVGGDFSVLAYGDMLSPEPGMEHIQTISHIQAALMCNLIEQRAYSWADKSIEKIYTDDMLMWQRVQRPYLASLKPVLSVGKKEILIDVPFSDLTIRYYDPCFPGNRTLIDGTDRTITRTHIINSRVNRQVIRRTPGLSFGPLRKTEQLKIVFMDWAGTVIDTSARILNIFFALTEDLFPDRKTAECFFFSELKGKSLWEIFNILKKYSRLRGVEFEYEDYSGFLKALSAKKDEMKKYKPAEIKESVRFIKKLKSRGIKVYICSKAGKDILKKDIEALGIEGFVDGFYGIPPDEDEYLTKDQYIRKILESGQVSYNSAVMIGDSESDMMSAKAAGVLALGLADDIDDIRRLFEAGAGKVFTDFSKADEKIMEIDVALRYFYSTNRISPALFMLSHEIREKAEKGDLSVVDEILELAGENEPAVNDILLAGPVKALLDKMEGIVRPVSQAELLLKIEKIARYCTDEFIKDNIPAEILTKAYMKRKDFNYFAARASIGPILGKTLEYRTAEDIKFNVVLPLSDLLSDTGKRYKCCDIFAEVACQLPAEKNNIIFSEVVNILMRDMENLNFESMKALNTIFNNSDIYKYERKLLDQGVFDPDNWLMVKINYILWAKRFYRGNFNLFPGYHEYLKSIKDIKSESPAATRKELLNEELVPDLRAVVVEAYLAREKILEIYERAKELDRELILVENLSYGEISLAPVTEERAGVKYITGTDIKVISTKIASSWEQEMLTDILPGGEMRKIGEKQPLVVLVDGTINVTVRTEGEGCVHIPSSFAKEYVKFFMAVNKGLTGNVDPGDFYALESTVKAIEKNEEFKRVASFFSYFSGGKKPYKTFYWYPGDMVLANRSYSDIEKLGDTADITGPAVVMMQTVNDPGSLSKQAREYINSEYVPGGLDDKSYFKKSKFFYDGKNLPRLVNSMTEISRRMFRRFCKAYNKKIRYYRKGGRNKKRIKNGYFEGFLLNKRHITDTLLNASDDPVILRIPVEVIESCGEENLKSIIGYLNRFQGTKNGFVELFYMTGTRRFASESLNGPRKRFGIISKKLPLEIKRTDKNTITLFALLKGYQFDISDDPVQARKDINNILTANLGFLSVRDTQIVPVGLQEDPLGILRGMIIGLELIHIARYDAFRKTKKETIDKEFISRFVDPAVDEFRKLCGKQGIKDFDIHGADIVDLASGKPDDRIRALKKIIDTLPVEPLDTEEIRRVYESASQMLLSA